MITQTSLVAQQIRLQQWAEQIRDCQSRPKGMDVETIHKTVTENSINPVPVIRIKNENGVSAEVFSHASLEILSYLIEAFHHVK